MVVSRRGRRAGIALSGVRSEAAAGEKRKGFMLDREGSGEMGWLVNRTLFWACSAKLRKCSLGKRVHRWSYTGRGVAGRKRPSVGFPSSIQQRATVESATRQDGQSLF